MLAWPSPGPWLPCTLPWGKLRLCPGPGVADSELSHRDKAPGQRECDEAIEVLNKCMRDVDQASLAAISQQLAPREGISQEVSLGGSMGPLSGGSVLPQRRLLPAPLSQGASVPCS